MDQPEERRRMVTAIITLPLFYNPQQGGRRRTVEADRFYYTLLEIDEKFGGCRLKGNREVIDRLQHAFNEMALIATEAPAQLGSWLSGGRLYIDPEIELEVEIPDNEESREWLRKYEKEILRQRFQQEQVYIRLLHWVEPL